MRRKPRSVCIYGPSGSTKTSQTYHLVKHILSKSESKGKRFRMIHSDGGGYAPFTDSGMIERGEVEVIDFSNREHTLAHYRWLSCGYWPRVKKDGSEYFAKDEHCQTNDWDNILGYIVEGLTSTATTLKTHISTPTGSFKKDWGPLEIFEEEGETLTGLQQSHYGMIQKEIYERHMKGFNTLPIDWIICTALLGKGKDKEKKEIYGPQIAGDAITAEVPSWFMDCFHCDYATWDDGKGHHENEMVAWFIRHQDEMGINYLAKARSMPEKFPELLKIFPMGFVPLGYRYGIEKYFIALDYINKKDTEENA